jgi:hypothetical protein
MMEKHSRSRLLLAVAVLAVVAVASLVAVVWAFNELAGTRTSLSLTESELAGMQAQLTGAHGDLAVIQAQLDASDQLVEYLEASLFDLQVNYDRLTVGYGYLLRDPSYRAMQEFLAADMTSGEDYVIGEYTCVDFAAQVKANAARQGIRCAYVVIEYRGGSGHAAVAFQTTDRGLVFVEPQFDWEVVPEIGRRYYECVIAPPGRYMAEPDYDDTIARIIIIW